MSLPSGALEADAMAVSAAERLKGIVAGSVSPSAAGADWAELSGHYTELADVRSIRDDLNVICAPEAAMGHPGYYMPANARIALDGSILPVSPENLDTENPEHLAALSALQGVFVHELGHAVHTDAMRAALDGKEAENSRLLEEIRMEAKAIADRPQDAIWLRAATHKIILGGDQSPADIANREHAARIAVLIEGRVAAGTLKAEDAAEVTAALEAIFDPQELAELRDIFDKTVALEDGDTDGLTEQARRLRELIGNPEEGEGEGEGEQGEGEGQGEGQGQGQDRDRSGSGSRVKVKVR